MKTSSSRFDRLIRNIKIAMTSVTISGKRARKTRTNFPGTYRSTKF